ncbi:MAG: LptF/LptG family permease [Rhizobiales bacterium]|nr:LptF/LptG family permease [Hyphomicrobiales bacterium]
MLRIVDRHVLKQITTPLVAAMTIGLVMLLAERMVRLLDTTLGKKNSFGVVFEMLAYLVPHYLGTAIPAALVLGLLFGFSRMSANSETDAFMASGIGLNRLARPVIVLAAGFSLVSLFVVGWAQPYTRYAYRSVVFEVTNVEVFYLAEEGVFMQSGSRTFILDSLDRNRNAFGRVFIFDDQGAKGTDTVTASKGALVEVAGEFRPVLHLETGRRLSFKSQPGPDAANATRPEASDFAIADTPLGKISKNIFRPRGDDQRELTIPELIAQLDNPPKGATAASMRAELHKRIIDVLSILILPFLALPFAVGPRRSQRAYRFGFALVLIIAFHEIIQQGSVAARSGSVSPWLVMWLPLGILSLFAGWRYYSACFTVNRDTLDTTLDRIGDATTGLRRRFMRRLGWETAR